MSALTFDDLRRWLAQEKIAPETLTAEAEDNFIPEQLRRGRLVPRGRRHDRRHEIPVRGE